MIEKIVSELNYYILYYFIITSFYYIYLLIAAIPAIINRFQFISMGRNYTFAEKRQSIPVTIIIPAWNEQDNILNCVQSVLNSNYNSLHAIVISDGSTDNTIPLLKEKYQLEERAPVIPNLIKTAKINKYYVSKTHPTLAVIDKVHSGTGDSMNAGVNATTTPLLMTVDADSMIDPDAVGSLVHNIVINNHVVMVGGSVYLLNNCQKKDGYVVEAQMPKGFIERMQCVEYLRSFVFGRCGLNTLKGALSFSGTCSMFEHRELVAVGGFDLNNPAQDAEIVIHLHQHMHDKNFPYQIIFAPTATAWTLVPKTFKSYTHQRINWQYGIIKSMLRHVKMCFNPKYGITGVVTYPLYLFVETFGSLVEFTTYMLINISFIGGFLDIKGAILFFILSAGLSSFLTMATMMINIITFNQYKKLSDVLMIFVYSLLEMVGFRQYRVTCATIGTFKYAYRALKRAFKRKNRSDEAND